MKFYEIDELEFVRHGNTKEIKASTKAHNHAACGVLYSCDPKKMKLTWKL